MQNVLTADPQYNCTVAECWQIAIKNKVEVTLTGI